MASEGGTEPVAEPEFKFADKKLWGRYTQWEVAGQVFAPISHNYLYGSTDHDLDDRLDKLEEAKPGTALEILEGQVRMYAILFRDKDQDREEPTPKMLSTPEGNAYTRAWVDWMRRPGSACSRSSNSKKLCTRMTTTTTGASSISSGTFRSRKMKCGTL